MSSARFFCCGIATFLGLVTKSQLDVIDTVRNKKRRGCINIRIKRERESEKKEKYTLEYKKVDGDPTTRNESMKDQFYVIGELGKVLASSSTLIIRHGVSFVMLLLISPRTCNDHRLGFCLSKAYHSIIRLP